MPLDDDELTRLEADEARDERVSKLLNQAAKWLAIAIFVGCLALALSGCTERPVMDWSFA